MLVAGKHAWHGFSGLGARPRRRTRRWRQPPRHRPAWQVKPAQHWASLVHLELAAGAVGRAPPVERAAARSGNVGLRPARRCRRKGIPFGGLLYSRRADYSIVGGLVRALTAAVRGREPDARSSCADGKAGTCRRGSVAPAAIHAASGVSIASAASPTRRISTVRRWRDRQGGALAITGPGGLSGHDAVRGPELVSGVVDGRGVQRRDARISEPTCRKR